MNLYTTGIVKHSAQHFFEVLKHEGVKRMLDIRLKNTSQLAGFTKKQDLPYFLQELCGISYYHMQELAPTNDILVDYKRNGLWDEYEEKFKNLMRERRIIERLKKGFFGEKCCLLCVEATPEHCHRRLVAEAIRQRWPEINIIHL